MAGHVNLEDNSMGEDESRPSKHYLNIKDLLNFNHKVASQSSLSIASISTLSTSTSPRNALITESPGILELRQNTPQDCTNLIIASVNRATVEISRTIIALNATFSQQLQQASISASNGIKSAQGSASTTISIVVQSASIATSSALSSLTIANLAVTSFSSASISDVARVSSSSSSDVSTLSASVNLLQSSISSLQASAASALASAQSDAQSSASTASVALASAQSALSSASVAFSAAAGAAAAIPAGSLAAPAGSAATPVQVCATGTLPLAQVLAIGIGAIIVVTILSFAIYFMVVMIKKRKQARDSYCDEKNFATSPRKIPSRYSSSARTGNAITIKFGSTKSSAAPAPSKPAMHHTESLRTPSFSSERNSIETLVVDRRVDFPASALPSWPLTFSFMNKADVAPTSPVESVRASRPLQEDIPATLSPKATSSQWTSKVLPTPEYIQPVIPAVPVVSQTSTAIKPPRSPRGSNARTTTAAPQQLIVDSLPSLPPSALKVESPQTSLFDDPCDDSIEKKALQQLLTERDESMLVGKQTTYPTDDQPRNNAAPEIDMLGALITGNNEHTGNRPLSDVDIEAAHTTVGSPPEAEMENTPEAEMDIIPEPEIEKTSEPMAEWASLSPPSTGQTSQDEIIVEEAKQDDEVAIIADQAEWPFTPAKQTSTGEVDITNTELPSPKVTEEAPRESSQFLAPANTVNIERYISPLRRNPFIPDTTSSPAEPEKSFLSVLMNEDEDEDEGEDKDATNIHEERGRSMIRTSDIIESRLSGIQAAIEELKPVDIAKNHTELERTFSPLRLNPVNRSVTPVPIDQRSEAKSSLAANPKRISKSLSPPPRSNSLRRVLKNNSLSRENSPLRHSPVRAPVVRPNTKLSASAIASRPQAKEKFAQILSQFKFIADQNPNDSFKTSQEVTQRAIAGIAIPSSMREQAVRNSGKSRERGKSNTT